MALSDLSSFSCFILIYFPWVVQIRTNSHSSNVSMVAACYCIAVLGVWRGAVRPPNYQLKLRKLKDCESHTYCFARDTISISAESCQVCLLNKRTGFCAILSSRMLSHKKGRSSVPPVFWNNQSKLGDPQTYLLQGYNISNSNL